MNKKTSTVIFFAVLSAIVCIGIGIAFKDKLGDKLAPIALMMIGAAGLAVSISALISDKRRRNRCTLIVSAECVGVSQSRDSDGITVYAPKWRYTVNGEEFTVQENVFTNVAFNIGDRKDILANPAEPRVIYTPNAVRTTAPTVIGAVCAAVFIIGTVLLLRLLR